MKPPRVTTSQARNIAGAMSLRVYTRSCIIKRLIEPNRFSNLLADHSPYLASWRDPTDKRPHYNILLKEIDPETSQINYYVFACHTRHKAMVLKILEAHERFIDKWHQRADKREAFINRMEKGKRAPDAKRPGRPAKDRTLEGITALDAWNDASLWKPMLRTIKDYQEANMIYGTPVPPAPEEDSRESLSSLTSASTPEVCADKERSQAPASQDAPKKLQKSLANAQPQEKA